MPTMVVDHLTAQRLILIHKCLKLGNQASGLFAVNPQ